MKPIFRKGTSLTNGQIVIMFILCAPITVPLLCVWYVVGFVQGFLTEAFKPKRVEQTDWSDFLDVSPAALNPKPRDFLHIDREAGEVIVRNISELDLKTDNPEDYFQDFYVQTDEDYRLHVCYIPGPEVGSEESCIQITTESRKTRYEGRRKLEIVHSWEEGETVWLSKKDLENILDIINKETKTTCKSI